MVNIQFSAIELKNVRGVLIDLDNTLYLYEPCHEFALESCYSLWEQGTWEEFKLTYRAARNDVTRRLSPQGACRSRLLAFQNMFESLKIKKAHQLALRYERQYWTAFLQKMEIFNPAYRFLEKCNSLEIPICIVSDMLTSVQIQKVEQLGIMDLVQFLVTSEEAGAEKPHKEIFEMGLKKLKKKAEEVIMVGDSLEKDVHGAQRLGIKSYLVELK